MLARVSPTTFSEAVNPGLNALVLSAIISVTPLAPISASFVKFIGSPSTGV